MKVTDKAGAGITGLAGGVAKKPGVEKSIENKLGNTSKANLADSAKVDLSSRAQDIKKAQEIASKGLNDVDEAKVAKFRDLIDGGKYKVNAQAVADRLVDEHIGTLGAQSDEE